MKNRIIDTDVLIIGGGTAGCFAGITLGKKKDLDVLIVEKANIVRSGCLAAGVNAINAYITKGRVPQDYVDYCKKDADGIVREDLLLSMSERLNHVTKVMEDLGLVILKDENGDYVARGNRNIKINGENIKPILADAVKKQDNVTVINHLNITDFIHLFSTPESVFFAPKHYFSFAGDIQAGDSRKPHGMPKQTCFDCRIRRGEQHLRRSFPCVPKGVQPHIGAF